MIKKFLKRKQYEKIRDRIMFEITVQEQVINMLEECNIGNVNDQLIFNHIEQKTLLNSILRYIDNEIES